MEIIHIYYETLTREEGNFVRVQNKIVICIFLHTYNEELIQNIMPRAHCSIFRTKLVLELNLFSE